VIQPLFEHRMTFAGYKTHVLELEGDGIPLMLPVLVVWGRRDRLLFHEGAHEIIDSVPGARLELLPGVGHCPQVEAPQRLTDLVLDFGSELAAPSAA
jgi:pimeloyl-ACP methyl ester carboxylesterase